MQCITLANAIFEQIVPMIAYTSIQAKNLQRIPSADFYNLIDQASFFLVVLTTISVIYLSCQFNLRMVDHGRIIVLVDPLEADIHATNNLMHFKPQYKTMCQLVQMQWPKTYFPQYSHELELCAIFLLHINNTLFVEIKVLNSIYNFVLRRSMYHDDPKLFLNMILLKLLRFFSLGHMMFPRIIV